jgi:hypothetical protein
MNFSYVLLTTAFKALQINQEKQLKGVESASHNRSKIMYPIYANETFVKCRKDGKITKIDALCG